MKHVGLPVQETDSDQPRVVEPNEVQFTAKHNLSFLLHIFFSFSFFLYFSLLNLQLTKAGSGLGNVQMEFQRFGSDWLNIDVTFSRHVRSAIYPVLQLEILRIQNPQNSVLMHAYQE